MLTAAALAGLIAGTSAGRFAAAALALRARRAAASALGLPPDRAEVDAAWRLKRARGVEQTARRYRAFFDGEASPGWRRILTAAGMAPGDVLLRWANYDWTVVLSSRVFAPDDSGRAYHLRPRTRAFWTVNHALPHGLNSFFFLPDTPEVRAALDAAGEPILPESFQATNSWGCRGPEPDPSAPVRGLVLGDSFMQGIFVADAETPPEQLRRYLQDAWGVPVSVLNTGHIGYSPEQYYHTLLAYHDRFRPQFVVLSVCPNDFGDLIGVLHGHGDWEEGEYWLGLIEQFCRTHRLPLLLTTTPLESQVRGRRYAGNFPGRVSNLFGSSSRYYVNLLDAFTEEDLRLRDAAGPLDGPARFSPLFNGRLGDAHFSALGCSLWSRVIGRRLVLLLDPPPHRDTPRAGRRPAGGRSGLPLRSLLQ